MPNTSRLWYKPVLTTALMQAFMPGESPPEVMTPILVTFFSIDLLVWVKMLGSSRKVNINRVEVANLTNLSQISPVFCHEKGMRLHWFVLPENFETKEHFFAIPAFFPGSPDHILMCHFFVRKGLHVFNGFPNTEGGLLDERYFPDTD